MSYGTGNVGGPRRDVDQNIQTSLQELKTLGLTDPVGLTQDNRVVTKADFEQDQKAGKLLPEETFEQCEQRLSQWKALQQRKITPVAPQEAPEKVRLFSPDAPVIYQGSQGIQLINNLPNLAHFNTPATDEHIQEIIQNVYSCSSFTPNQIKQQTDKWPEGVSRQAAEKKLAELAQPASPPIAPEKLTLFEPEAQVDYRGIKGLRLLQGLPTMPNFDNPAAKSHIQEIIQTVYDNRGGYTHAQLKQQIDKWPGGASRQAAEEKLVELALPALSLTTQPDRSPSSATAIPKKPETPIISPKAVAQPAVQGDVNKAAALYEEKLSGADIRKRIGQHSQVIINIWKEQYPKLPEDIFEQGNTGDEQYDCTFAKKHTEVPPDENCTAVIFFDNHDGILKSSKDALYCLAYSFPVGRIQHHRQFYAHLDQKGQEKGQGKALELLSKVDSAVAIKINMQ